MSTFIVGEWVVVKVCTKNRIKCVSHRNLKRGQEIKQNLLELVHHPHFIGRTLRIKLRITRILNTFFNLYQGQLLTNGVHLLLMYISILTLSVNVSRNNKKMQIIFLFELWFRQLFLLHKRYLKWHKYVPPFPLFTVQLLSASHALYNGKLNG